MATLTGTANADYLTSTGNDSISGLGGNDYIRSMNGGRTTIDGGTGNDYIMSAGNGLIFGGDGNDTINGMGKFVNRAGDSIDAGSGDDFVYIKAGLYGAPVLLGNLLGGDGHDKLHLEIYSAKNTVVDLSVVPTTVLGNTISGFEDLSINDATQKGTVKLIGNTADNRLDAMANQVTISGGEGNDWIYGNGVTKNVLSGDNGNDSIGVYMGNNSINGGEGNDSLIGGKGNDTLIGGNGNDTLVSGRVDLLRSPDGSDQLTGGTGADLFTVADFRAFGTTATTTDKIMDFSNVEGDKIVIPMGVPFVEEFVFQTDVEFRGTSALIQNTNNQVALEYIGADTVVHFLKAYLEDVSLTATPNYVQKYDVSDVTVKNYHVQQSDFVFTNGGDWL